MVYDTDNLLDFYSVRSYDQIDYYFNGLNEKNVTFF